MKDFDVPLFTKLLRESFHAELNAKTGWGKEELKVAFERSLNTTLAWMLEKMQQAEQ